MFGNKVEDEVAFTSFIEEAGPLFNDFPLDDMFPSNRLLHMISGRRRKIEKHRHACDKILDRIIKDHVPWKADKRKGEGAQEDLVDVLLGVALQDGNFDISMITKAIKGVILETFIAASETSASVIDWAMSEMIKNPGIMQEAQAEVRHVYEEKGMSVDESCIHKLMFLKLIIKETLRLYPPGPLLLPRESIERCQINGYEIPAKSRTIINAWAIGRDPMYWSDADSFIPKRFHDCPIDYKGNNFEYIPFGSGRRMCPGLLFAMANIELSLAMLLYHFDWSLPDGLKHHDLDMTETCSASLRRKKNLYVIPTPFRRDKMPLGLGE
ncbi:hypothetical protein Nepgr_028892 [Nepenthes gracilis]|uniref:Cytochrome P450 n=1 Tax=Nepenthes gracilis TaxID=150966 RepID=A0AAD3TDQ3_NEPGR|nr:hypothetical protein Nepgr_028892 [Nepenthes gracilis]